MIDFFTAAWALVFLFIILPISIYLCAKMARLGYLNGEKNFKSRSKKEWVNAK